MLRILTLLLALSVTAACASPAAQPGAQNSAQRLYEAPTTPKSILVVTDHVADDGYAMLHATQVMIALRHFTPNTSWIYVDQLNKDRVSAADAVVYLGDNGQTPIATGPLEAFRAAKTLVVTRFHVHQFHDAGIAFTHIKEGIDVASPAELSATYHGTTVPVKQADYVKLELTQPATIVSTLSSGGEQGAYIVRDGAATFINGTIDFDKLGSRPAAFGQNIIVADALNDALRAAPLVSSHVAMLRLEDVSVQTPALRLKAIVDYLAAEHVPYGLGLIPDQLIRGRVLSTLSQDPQLVTVLRFAQAHGATIILHGLHHSFNSPEDFEFYDQQHHRPLAQDSQSWMDGRISQGLQIERSLGLEPKMWETPHYTASPLDYGEVKKYFRVAWEQRIPDGWLPWPLQRDAFGMALLPENLGYVAYDGSTTVGDQLAIAKLLLLCRGCIAAGFLHPSTVPLADVQSYVTGLHNLGYHFADPGEFL
ncbi:MAG: DUF2334 domain-containing protein [Candidatus Eremiobacteraeota bacterium]|nr:DUF2334 domain-containing protein [Candidatus Eremiobacteraeota bacterium]